MGKKKKLLIIIATGLLSVGLIAGGVFAWLTASTDPVINTFTYGDINLTLTETDTNDGDNDPNTNQYEMLPGQDITKDPLVTVQGDSVDCWLFVKLEKSANYDDFMEFEIADGWTALAGEDGVYYREVTRSASDQTFTVLKDNTVTVKESVTKEMLNALDSDSNNPNYPTLTVISYAVQKAGIDTAADAWAKTGN